MKLAELKGKKVAVWGYGVEGRATAVYLSEKGIPFTVLCSVKEAEPHNNNITETITTEILNGFDVIIKSPGISPYSDLSKSVTVSITSPTAIWFANEKQAPVIVVTGTKGKSTTASLLAHVLASCGLNVNLVGNIGQALISSGSDYDYIVLEASSFQIYDGNIQADIALMNNMFPEHLDWHKGEENYYRDKLKLIKTSKIKIINARNDNLRRMVTDSDVIFFNDKNGFHNVGNDLYFKNQYLLSISQTQLLGMHNLQNIAAVMTICRILDLPVKKVLKAIRAFTPLAHRLQSLGIIAGFHAINDSIATTPIATMAALDTLGRENTTLLAGGYDRGNDWSQFADSLCQQPPARLIVSGQNAKSIYNHLIKMDAKFDFSYCKTLKDAIKLAVEITPQKGIILLSPGAPSFDQFSSYLERGGFFEQELQKYEE